MRHRTVTALSAIFVSLNLTGCGFYGPESVRLTRPDYNVAIQRTNDQELLLNLARLKYRDTPYFMNVEKVVSSLEVNRGLSASGTFPESGSNTLGLGGSVTFNEKPSIFYSPLEGEKFVRRLMTPMKLDTLLLLTHSGWSVERVFAVTLQEMNGLRNAPTASGPTPDREPDYRDFREAIHLLRSLQIKNSVEIGRVGDAESSTLELRFSPAAAGDPDAARFRELLGLARDKDRFRVVQGLGAPDDGSIAVTTRSLIASMSYLAQGVEAPASDLGSGRITATVADNGKPFDWQQMLGGLFRVASADSLPETAGTSVRYRDTWFYIDDRDLDSKSTFSLLAQLFALQAGGTPGQGPALSFSIGP
jgi:hypothetical protein